MNKLKNVNWYYWTKKLFPYLAILLTTYLMFSYQINNHVTLLTSDAWIHFYRFYDTSQQIKTGNFSYFQTNYGFSQTGRIFNAFYGPFFAYLNGLLILICGTWYHYQLLIIFTVMLIGGIGMFKLLLKVKANKIIALLLTLIYLQNGLLSSIVRFNFVAIGSMLAPYVIIQAVNMVEDKNHPIHWINLAIIMSLLAQTHLLSTIILTITIVPFAVYSLINTQYKKQMVIDLLKSIALATLLTANIWGAFLTVYRSNKISMPNSFLISYFTMKLGLNNVGMRINTYRNTIVFFMAILILIQVFFIFLHFKQSPLNNLATLVAVILFLISSPLFPWKHIQAAYPKFAASFQFPYRLTVGAWPLILLGIGITFNYLWQKKNNLEKDYIILALSVVFLQAFIPVVVYNYNKTVFWTNPHRPLKHGVNYFETTKDPFAVQKALNSTNDLTLFKLIKHVEPDYLPIKVRANNLKYRNKVLLQHKKYHYLVSGKQLILTWNARKNKKQTLPLVMYKQSQLMLNGNQIKNLNSICQPIIRTRKGKNIAILSFNTPITFTILLWITIFSWLGLGIYGIKYLVRKNNYD